MERTTVVIEADDSILQAGIAGQLRPYPQVRVVDPSDRATAAVVLVVTDRVTEHILRLLRSGRRQGSGLVLVVSDIDDIDFTAVVEAGVIGLVRRREATPDRLVTVIRSTAAGEGAVPADLLGLLLTQYRQERSCRQAVQTLPASGLRDREVQVLRLIAEGKDTAQIAAQLSYSQRTVKNVIHDVTSRLHLQNRTHAVAYALREGLL